MVQGRLEGHGCGVGPPPFKKKLGLRPSPELHALPTNGTRVKMNL